MRHADLRREEAAVKAAKPALAPLYDNAVWYLVWGMGVWAWGCVVCGGMSDAMGSKTCLRLTFSTGSAS